MLRPTFQPTLVLCPVGADAAALDAARRQDCLAMLGLIAADESVLLYPLIVLSGLVQLTADAPDGAQWRERLRRLYWLYQQATPRLPGASDANISGADYIRLIADAGEFDAMREVLRRHRIPLRPPADWLPQEARHRALVTTGVEPLAGERGR